MLDTQVEPQSAKLLPARGETQVVASVGFVGRFNGLLSVYTTQGLATDITRRLLGTQNGHPHEDMVNDAVGELTNMVGGQVKSRLADRGFPCRLSLPSIVRGEHFSIGSVTDTTRRTLTFHYHGHALAVEMILKPTC
jgi:chemotaxis protein CheX